MTKNRLAGLRYICSQFNDTSREPGPPGDQADLAMRAIRYCCWFLRFLHVFKKVQGNKRNQQLRHDVAKWAAKVVREAVKYEAKEIVKLCTKQVMEEAAKQATKQGADFVVNIIKNGAIPPGPLAAGVFQLGLEAFGCKTAGKVVGASGNIIFGAMAAR